MRLLLSTTQAEIRTPNCRTRIVSSWRNIFCRALTRWSRKYKVYVCTNTQQTGTVKGEAGRPACSQGLSPEDSVLLGATHCAWHTAAVPQVLVQ